MLFSDLEGGGTTKRCTPLEVDWLGLHPHHSLVLQLITSLYSLDVSNTIRIFAALVNWNMTKAALYRSMSKSRDRNVANSPPFFT